MKVPSESAAIPFELEALAFARRYQAWIGDTIVSLNVLEHIEKDVQVIASLCDVLLSGRVLGRTEIGTGSIRAFEALCPLIRPIDTFIPLQRPPA